MSIKADRQYMEREAEKHGLFIMERAPGDGATRYDFYRVVNDQGGIHVYFTAIGLREACTFILGVTIGRKLEYKTIHHKEGVK